jgi:hypothetical protein
MGEVQNPQGNAEVMVALSDPLRDTIAEIAKECGVSNHVAAHLHQHLAKRFLPLKRALDDVGNDEMAKLFRYRSWEILRSISEEDIENAPLRDKMVSAAIAVDKSLLLEGQPTQILSIKQLENLDTLAGALLKEASRRGIGTMTDDSTQQVTARTETHVGTRMDPSMKWPDPDGDPGA